MASSLPALCLAEIFSCLEDDMGTLHSCILVNRNWCTNAITFLWRNPFSVVHESSLLETIYLCLSEDMKRKIEPSIPYLDSKQLAHQYSNSKQPAFPYPKFIKHLDANKVFTLVHGLWYINSAEATKLICHMIINSGGSLWDLKLHFDWKCPLYFSSPDPTEWSLFNLPAAHQSLSRLRHLTITEKYCDIMLSFATTISPHLVELFIVYNPGTSEIGFRNCIARLHAIFPLLKRWKELATLSISYQTNKLLDALFLDDPEPCDDFLIALAESMPSSVHNLYLDFNLGFTKESLIKFFDTTGDRFHKLSFQMFTGFTDEHLHVVSQHASGKLMELDISAARTITRHEFNNAKLNIPKIVVDCLFEQFSWSDDEYFGMIEDIGRDFWVDGTPVELDGYESRYWAMDYFTRDSDEEYASGGFSLDDFGRDFLS